VFYSFLSIGDLRLPVGIDQKVKASKVFVAAESENSHAGSLKQQNKRVFFFVKRAIDIVLSGTALLVLSPILLIVMALIKMESRGPVFFVSKRIGTGFNKFDLLKFRTMCQDADSKLKDLKHLNMYSNASSDSDSTSPECVECKKLGKPCSPMLYSDKEEICERLHLQRQQEDDSEVFMKIQNDPRVTRFGKLMRNTSIDELPQLINVLKGDISLVGNRPLPLYEAEKLTTDEWAERFLAPAGVTGLWQVTKRGTANLTHEERIELDNQYARNCSMLTDIKIILKTFPALLQKESV